MSVSHDTLSTDWLDLQDYLCSGLLAYHRNGCRRHKGRTTRHPSSRAASSRTASSTKCSTIVWCVARLTVVLSTITSSACDDADLRRWSETSPTCSTWLVGHCPANITNDRSIDVLGITHDHSLRVLGITHDYSINLLEIAPDALKEKLKIARNHSKRNITKDHRSVTISRTIWMIFSGVARAPQAPRPRGPVGLKGPARGPSGRSSRCNPLLRGGGGARKSSLHYWWFCAIYSFSFKASGHTSFLNHNQVERLITSVVHSPIVFGNLYNVLFTVLPVHLSHQIRCRVSVV